MKEVLVFHPGLATYRVDFFNALNKCYDAVFYLSYKTDSSHLFDQNGLLERCDFKPKYLSRGFHIFRKTFRFGLFKIIKKENPNIVICSEFGPITISVCLFRMFSKKGFKLYTISDDSIDAAKNRNRFRTFVRNTVSRRIDGIIFPSSKVCEWYKKNISSELKTMVLPIIQSDDKYREDLKLSLNTAKDNISKYKLTGNKVILYVGRLVHVKNISFLISVFSSLKHDRLKLIIVGDGILKKELEDQTSELGLNNKILFLGRQQEKELLAWYALAQVFVLPSIYEPYGAVVNEALLSGCQVLCSDLAGATSLINEKNGRIIDPFDKSSLVTSLNEVLNETDYINDENLQIRKSKMPFTFQESIDELFEQL